MFVLLAAVDGSSPEFDPWFHVERESTEAAGKEPKEVQIGLRADKAQFSRWTDDKEGITWSKLSALMDFCGNDAPLLWMLQARGYDLSSLRKQETELEKKLRLAEERIQALELRHEHAIQTIRELRVNA